MENPEQEREHIVGMVEQSMTSEPNLMNCPECVHKHLRDVEHHLEDMTRVTAGDERKFYDKLIDRVREDRKHIFNIIVEREVTIRGGTTPEIEKETKKRFGCTTCELKKLANKKTKCTGSGCKLKKEQPSNPDDNY